MEYGVRTASAIPTHIINITIPNAFALGGTSPVHKPVGMVL